MTTYTIEQLTQEGPKFAMAMLLDCLKLGEPFITYGDICVELEKQLDIDTIFPTQIGYVAGALMDLILKNSPNAPLINVLIARPSGIPGAGVGNYLADRYGKSSYRNWSKITLKSKKKLIEEERQKIFKYKKWQKISEDLFGISLNKISRERLGSKNDIYGLNRYGGPAESKEHKKLKAWVANNPQGIGIRKSFGIGIEESRLLSGDEIDVLFADGVSFRTVEVKSKLSNDADLKRGIYQCVKYREIKRAEHAPYNVEVQAILVTERELPNALKERAKLLKVRLKRVSLD